MHWSPRADYSVSGRIPPSSPRSDAGAIRGRRFMERMIAEERLALVSREAAAESHHDTDR